MVSQLSPAGRRGVLPGVLMDSRKPQGLTPPARRPWPWGDEGGVEASSGWDFDGILMGYFSLKFDETFIGFHWI